MKVFRLLFVLVLMLTTVWLVQPSPTYAQNAPTCKPEQVFAAASPLQFSINGANYKPMSAQVNSYLKTITACPITQPIPMGAYQSLGFLADGDALTVRTVGAQVYVYRAWKIYPISREQWGCIVGLLMPKRWGV